MTRALLAALFLGLAWTPLSSAQSFNMDMGIDNPVPSSTFGGAAAQPGVWNQIAPGGAVVPLLDLAGAPSGVTIQRTIGTGGDISWNHVGTSGDDELLMDDGEFPSSLAPSTWVISGLAAGTYSVTSYAWAPDSDALRTDVSVNGGPVTTVGGTWTGTYSVPVTHALDTVTIGTGGTISVMVSKAAFPVSNFATFNGLQIHLEGSSFTVFCSGDGSGTACPCGNPGAAGNGCASSLNAAGAHLAGSGTPSISNDTFVLTGSGMPDSSALYFQGTSQVGGGAGAAFGDGLRCVGGTIARLGTKTNSGGTSSYPSGGDASISVKGMNSAGAVRDYQAWYRNAAAFCTASTFNLTNGLEATWGP